MTPYQKAILVMDYLQELKVGMLTIGRAIDDKRIDQSCKLIMENPKITKREFLEAMQLEDED